MPDEQEPRQASSSSRVRWFGRFAEQAEANDPGQLAYAIEDFIGRFRLDRDHHLLIEPATSRMFSARLEPPPAGSRAVAVRIPVGTDRRRAGLINVGWAIERVTSGTRYYTRRFSRRDVAPEEVARAMAEAYQLIYENRARDLRWRVRVIPVHVEESDIGRTEPRSRIYDALLGAGVGLFCSWAVLQSFGNHSGWLLTPWLVVTVILGSMLCSAALNLTGAPMRFARPNSEFWGGGRLAQAIVAASLCGCASLAWGIALVVMFGTRPGGQ